jgi:hypothetical protein
MKKANITKARCLVVEQKRVCLVERVKNNLLSPFPKSNFKARTSDTAS